MDVSLAGAAGLEDEALQGLGGVEHELRVGVEVADGFLVDLPGGQDEPKRHGLGDVGGFVDLVVLAAKRQGLVGETTLVSLFGPGWSTGDFHTGGGEAKLVDLSPDLAGQIEESDGVLLSGFDVAALIF